MSCPRSGFGWHAILNTTHSNNHTLLLHEVLVLACTAALCRGERNVFSAEDALIARVEASFVEDLVVRKMVG